MRPEKFLKFFLILQKANETHAVILNKIVGKTKIDNPEVATLSQFTATW